MKFQKIAKLALLSCTLGICFHVTDLMAWERTPVDYNKCKTEGIATQRCKKETEENNKRDFEALLSTNSFTIYNDFLPDQKKQAMDYADHNQMSPDDAVAKVRGKQ